MNKMCLVYWHMLFHKDHWSGNTLLLLDVTQMYPVSEFLTCNEKHLGRLAVKTECSAFNISCNIYSNIKQ